MPKAKKPAKKAAKKAAAKSRAAQNAAALAALETLRDQIPWAFDDNGRGDFMPETVLCALRGLDVSPDRGKRYRFDWAGSQSAFNALRVPTVATLAPRRDLSRNFDDTRNIFICGDNLEALKILRKAYAGRVKMIYIDPPYNTGGDFVYEDDFRDPMSQYLRETGQVDANGKAVRSAARAEERKVNGRKHSKWMSMMFPRLFLAREFLSDDGVIFVSIDDNEVHHLRMLMNIVFGENNCEGVVSWRRRNNQPNDAPKMMAKVSEFILVYSKNSDALVAGESFYRVPLRPERLSSYSNPDGDSRGPWSSTPWMASIGQSGSPYSITTPAGVTYDGTWLGPRSTFDRLVKDERIFFPNNGKGKPRKKIFKAERAAQGQPPVDFWVGRDYGDNLSANAELKALFGEHERVYDYPKPVRLIKTMARIATRPDSIVMDFFAGSATTAHAAMLLNLEDGGTRQSISVQLPEPVSEKSKARVAGFSNVAEIGIERLRRAGNDIAEKQNGGMLESAVDTGFRVYDMTPSAFRPWRGAEGQSKENWEAAQRLALDSLPKKTDEDSLVVEVMLEEGYPLTSKVERVAVDAGHVWRISAPDSAEDGTALHVFFGKETPDDLAVQLDLPLGARLVVRDKSLTDTAAVTQGTQTSLRAI